MPGNFTVYANQHTIKQKALNTKISVKRGDTMQFTLNSEQTWVCYGKNRSGPDGRNNPVSPYGTSYHFRCGTLVGTLDHGTSYFAIGNGGSITAPKDGILCLHAWDTQPNDNSGKMIVQTTITGTQKDLVLNATDTWKDTGIDLQRDAPISITATGLWKVDDLPGTIEVSADGYGSPIPGTPFNGSFAALIGRIGDNAPFLVGSKLENFNSPNAGRLFLQINEVEGDVPMADNVGALQISITQT
jgi:hypothetical protein